MFGSWHRGGLFDLFFRLLQLTV